MDILRKPSLEDLTRTELIELIRRRWGEPDSHVIADIVWQRMIAEVDALRESAQDDRRGSGVDAFSRMVDQLDEARKLEAKATSYYHRWVLGE